MQQTFKIEGSMDADTRSLLTLQIGAIESRKIGDDLFILTIFNAREGFYNILEEFGFRIIEEAER